MNDLPAEIMLHVVQYCPIRDTVNLLSCDRALHAYMRFEPLWRDVTVRDFGCVYTDLQHDDTVIERMRALYADLGACATVLHQSPNYQRTEQIGRCLEPLQQLVKRVYHNRGFATAVSVVKHIDGMLNSAYATERLSKFMIRLVDNELNSIYIETTSADAADRAVAIIGDVKYKPVVKQMANVVFELMSNEYALRKCVGTYYVSIKRIYATYRVTCLHPERGTVFQSNNRVITEALNQLHQDIPAALI